MRFIMIHVNSFRSCVTEKGRSRVVEPAEPPETAVGESVVVLASVEAGDEEKWFNTLEIDAKGHPYSRVARVVRAYESGPPT
ncbi:MAG: threonyl-tRNA synthetase editing domain-containing protein [Firmicutes bacterium]|nr:threonyl-tRNA synthetase editing domain-containing protein [Bacillota bacterium]MCL5057448.1 threonyl-tRNA synthetase editing domain-containing protein [Actinomycetota bacterium]